MLPGTIYLEARSVRRKLPGRAAIKRPLMLAFIIRRGFQAIGVLLAVGIIAFAMFRFAGDPVNQIVSLDTPAAEREQVRRSLGLDDPVPLQFVRYLAKAAQGDFGVSYQFRQPVSDLLAERMPATLELAICATLFATIFGVLMGVYSGLKRDRVLAKVFQTISLIGISLPTFLIGILLIYLFAVTLGWLPSYGRGDTVRIGWWSTGLLTGSGLKALIMPSITLGLFQMTLIMRIVRAEMLEVLRTDYIKFARARGLTTRAIHFGHALKNTLIPVITIVGLQFGSVIAFAIITETVFQWPGMGLLFVQAVQNVDIPIMAAYLMLVALIFVVINLAVDILYTVVDPRLRTTIRQPT
jgi:peptide/nickel transport system permease protein